MRSYASLVPGRCMPVCHLAAGVLFCLSISTPCLLAQDYDAAWFDEWLSTREFLADIDGDGDLDAFLVIYGGSEGPVTGLPERNSPPVSTEHARQYRVGDINSDGLVDLVQWEPTGGGAVDFAVCAAWVSGEEGHSLHTPDHTRAGEEGASQTVAANSRQIVLLPSLSVDTIRLPPTVTVSVPPISLVLFDVASGMPVHGAGSSSSLHLTPAIPPQTIHGSVRFPLDVDVSVAPPADPASETQAGKEPEIEPPPVVAYDLAQRDVDNDGDGDVWLLSAYGYEQFVTEASSFAFHRRCLDRAVEEVAAGLPRMDSAVPVPPATVAIALEATPNEAGRAEATNTEIQPGESVVVTAQTNPGYLFLYWSAEPESSVTFENFMEPRTEATLDGDAVVTAHFTPHDGLLDRDEDGMLDDWENAVQAPGRRYDSLYPWEDDDDDGLNSLLESRYLSSTTSKDTDGDSLPDGWEVAYGLIPTDPTDAEADQDGDGILNRDEYTSDTRLDRRTVEKGWNVVSVWDDGPYEWRFPVMSAWAWNAAEQQFLPFDSDSELLAGDGLILLLDRRSTSNSSTGGGGWSGTSCVSAGIMTGSATAWVTELAFELKTTAFPPGSGTVSPENKRVGAFDSDAFQVAAKPNTGFEFLTWTGDRNVVLQDPWSRQTDARLWGDGVLTANFRRHEGLADRDRDFILDTWEVACGLNPFEADDAGTDPDRDGLSNRQEFIHQCHPALADSDGDGIPDGDEIAADLDPNDPADALNDNDGDGLDNLSESRDGRPVNGKLLSPGWNLFSVAKPCTLKLPPDLAGSSYELNRSLPGHVPLRNGQTLNPAVGYWLHVTQPAEIDILTGDFAYVLVAEPAPPHGATDALGRVGPVSRCR